MKIFKPTKSTSLNVIIVSLLSLILVISAFLFFLPNIVRVSTTHWLAENGFESNIDVVDINLLDSKIEISGVKAINNDGRGFNVGKVFFDFSWAPLGDRQFVISGIELNEASITIRQHNDDMYVSGIALKSEAPDSVEETTAAAVEVVESVDFPWNVSLEELRFSNLNVCYQQTVDNSDKADATPMTLQDLCFDLGELHWKGNVDYTLTDDQAGHPFNINGEITFNDIAITNNHFDANSLTYDYVKLGKIYIVLHDDPDPEIPTLLPMKADKLELSDFDACFQKTDTGKSSSPLDGYCFQFGKFNWAGASGYSPAGVASDEALLHVDGTLSLNDIKVVNSHLQRNALAIGELLFDKIFIASFDDFKLNELSVRNFSALQKNKANNNYIVSFDSFSVAPIVLKNQNNLSIDKVSLNGLKLSYEKDKDGKLEHVQWLPAKSKATSNDASSPTPDSKQSDSFNYSIKSISISDIKSIEFVDNSLKEKFTAVITNANVDLGLIDSTKPGYKTSLALKTKIYKHGSFETSGFISPLASELTFDMKGKLRAIDLRKFNPYVKSAISHIIANGQMDTDLILVSNAGQLDSNVDLTLHKFELEPMSKEATAEINDIFGLPLNPSLALIRERDGSININVDIDGDASNPNINPVEIVTKAISTSIAKAVVVLYSPYGLVVGADMLFSLATALEFDPVDFDAGSTEINVTNAEEFSNLSRLLKDKPQIHIKLCGYTNNKDTVELFGIDREKEKNTTVTDEQVEELVELARNRAIKTKQHLIEKENVAADRVIMCTHKRKDAGISEISGVEISI